MAEDNVNTNVEKLFTQLSYDNNKAVDIVKRFYENAKSKNPKFNGIRINTRAILPEQIPLLAKRLKEIKKKLR